MSGRKGGPCQYGAEGTPICRRSGQGGGLVQAILLLSLQSASARPLETTDSSLCASSNSTVSGKWPRLSGPASLAADERERRTRASSRDCPCHRVSAWWVMAVSLASSCPVGSPACERRFPLSHPSGVLSFGQRFGWASVGRVSTASANTTSSCSGLDSASKAATANVSLSGRREGVLGATLVILPLLRFVLGLYPKLRDRLSLVDFLRLVDSPRTGAVKVALQFGKTTLKILIFAGRQGSVLLLIPVLHRIIKYQRATLLILVDALDADNAVLRLCDVIFA